MDEVISEDRGIAGIRQDTHQDRISLILPSQVLAADPAVDAVTTIRLEEAGESLTDEAEAPATSPVSQSPRLEGPLSPAPGFLGRAE